MPPDHCGHRWYLAPVALVVRGVGRNCRDARARRHCRGWFNLFVKEASWRVKVPFLGRLHMSHAFERHGDHLECERCGIPSGRMESGNNACLSLAPRPPSKTSYALAPARAPDHGLVRPPPWATRRMSLGLCRAANISEISGFCLAGNTRHPGGHRLHHRACLTAPLLA